MEGKGEEVKARMESGEKEGERDEGNVWRKGEKRMKGRKDECGGKEGMENDGKGRREECRGKIEGKGRRERKV